jgi:DNA-binding NarL/FixJ family response regulator
MQPTIIIADDHPLFRDAMHQAIQGLSDRRDIRLAGDLEETEALLASVEDVELVLLDLAMPGTNGLSALLRLRTAFPAIPVIIVSATDDSRTIRRAVELGASGFVPKSSTMNDIRDAVSAVLGGDIWLPPNLEAEAPQDPEFAELAGRLKSLTPQQSKVLAMLGEGLLNKQIAYELSVSEATVKAHVSAVLLKLGVDSRTQAVIALSRLGLSGLQEGAEAPQA